MLYFRIADVDGIPTVVEVCEDRPQATGPLGDDLIYRGDIKSFEHAEQIARQANALVKSKLSGQTYLACDAGEWVSPRYDVVLAPRVGEPVSYGFNGDYYPDGYITKVGGTNCSRVYTDTGSVYNRRRKSGRWVKRGGTWSLVSGHRKEQNPHF